MTAVTNIRMSKPKLRFSIDSLIGEQPDVAPRDLGRPKAAASPLLVPLPVPAGRYFAPMCARPLCEPAFFLPGEALHAAFPWYRQRFFQHRFSGPDLPGYLLPPFRKAKRIRTAFSASQLMKLESAFDKNHYVTGNERKQLAESLGLTETQVKVWFQNRRTKEKRQVIDDRSDKNSSTLVDKMESHDQRRSPTPDPELSPTDHVSYCSETVNEEEIV